MSKPTETCGTCGGGGLEQYLRNGYSHPFTRPCDVCNGRGKVPASAPTGPQSAAEVSVNKVDEAFTEWNRATRPAPNQWADCRIAFRAGAEWGFQQQQPDTATLLAIAEHMGAYLNDHTVVLPMDVRMWAERIEALCGKPRAGK